MALTELHQVDQLLESETGRDLVPQVRNIFSAWMLSSLISRICLVPAVVGGSAAIWRLHITRARCRHDEETNNFSESRPLETLSRVRVAIGIDDGVLFGGC
jgi:hypothetical protein